MYKRVIQCLRWIGSRARDDTEAKNRWGHYYDEAVDAGLVKHGSPHEVIVGRSGSSNGVRHMVVPISLSEAGKNALTPAKAASA